MSPNPVDAVQQLADIPSKLAARNGRTVIVQAPNGQGAGGLADVLGVSRAMVDLVTQSTEKRVQTAMTVEEERAALEADKIREEREELRASRELRDAERRARLAEQSGGGQFQAMQQMLDQYLSGSRDEVRALRQELQQIQERENERRYQAMVDEAHAESQAVRDELRALREAGGEDPYARDLERVEKLVERSKALREMFGVREASDEAGGMQGYLVRSRIRREEREFEERMEAEREERALRRRELEADMADRFHRTEQWDGLLERLEPVLSRIGTSSPLLGGRDGAAGAPAAQPAAAPPPPQLPPGVTLVACAQCGSPVPFAVAAGQTIGTCTQCGGVTEIAPAPEQPEPLFPYPDGGADGDLPPLRPTGAF